MSITMLKNNRNNTYDVVSTSEILIGGEFSSGNNIEGKDIIVTIKEVHEQRKEKGTYENELKRRMWARVS